ncbi:unnamed protein product [Linum trigynum]|uniref:RNase H type-1 domain-containing protein n=1 Tax=Linum trigynum TaxID=586398 RepID=A0AAV2CD00_9ROSI
MCASLDRVNRDFVWGEGDTRSRLHLVAWDKMVLPKSQGGAGLRSIQKANMVMLAKSGWRLIKEKDALWTQVVKTKYGSSKENLDLLRPVQGSSFTWKSLAAASTLLRSGCAWNIKNGTATKFWLDPWILQGPLKDMALEEIPAERLEEMVADLTNEDGMWCTERFAGLLPMDIQDKITSAAVDKFSTEKDTLFWTLSSNGKFSTKTAYESLLPLGTDSDAKFWKLIWSLPIPERVRCFVWLTCLGKLATNALRFSRKCAPSPNCARCNGQRETIIHILRDCPPASFLWTRHVPSNKQQRFFTSTTEDWLRLNLADVEEVSQGIPWSTFFSIAVWIIWKNRNDLCFKGISSTLTAPSLAHSVMAKVRLWHAAWIAPSLLPGLRSAPPSRVMADISWDPPRGGWMKLNLDGASNGNPGLAGAGGVLRDDSGRWISGFVAKVGEASAALAELWAFHYGLDIAWKSGCRALLVESDSQLAIQLINDRHDPVHPYATLLSSIRRRISRDWLVRISHVYREGNRVADWLSKHSLVYPYGVHELAHPPAGLLSILRDDVQGVAFQRRVVIPSSSPPLSFPPL